MTKPVLSKLFFIGIFGLSLTACGQMGPLYLPPAKQAAKSTQHDPAPKHIDKQTSNL